MPDKPLAQWRIDLRARLKARGYDLDEIYKTRDRRRPRLLILGLSLWALAFIILAVWHVFQAHGYR